MKMLASALLNRNKEVMGENNDVKPTMSIEQFDPCLNCYPTDSG